MKKLKISMLVLAMIFAMLFSTFAVSAFDFYGYARDLAGNALNATNVTVETKDPQQSWSVTQTQSALANASGFFNVTGLNETQGLFFKMTLVYYNASNAATKVGPVLPEFGRTEIEGTGGMPISLNNLNYTLVDGATINISAYNASGDTIAINGFLKINGKGTDFSIWEDHSSNNLQNKQIVVPVNKNYTLTYWSRGYSPPRSFSVYDSNLTVGNTFNVRENLSTTMYSITGYLLNNTAVGFTEMKSYLLVGDFYPIDAEIDFGTSTVNITSGYYDVSVPGPNVGVLISGYANDSTTYYGGFHNMTVTGNAEVNITLKPLSGSYKAGESYLANTSLTSVTCLRGNGTVNLSLGQTWVNVEQGNVTWAFESNTSGVGFIPLVNDSNAVVKIFSTEGPPRESTFTAAQLNSLSTLTTVTYGMDMMLDPDGDEMNVTLAFYKSNSSCDAPNADSGCLLGSFTPATIDSGGFNPMAAIVSGPVTFSITDSSGIQVLYLDTDMIASGPPDAAVEGTPVINTSSASGIERAYQLGFLGPSVYSSILIKIPYDDTEIDEDYSPIRYLIPLLYDNNWDVVWNVSANTIAQLPSEYSDYSTDWFNATLGGMACSKTDTSANCYWDTTNNNIWIKIPHFSGVAPQIVAYPALGTITSDRTNYQCYPNCTAYINVTVENSTTAGIHNITINNTDSSTNAINLTYAISYRNLTGDYDWVSAGQNNTIITNYNLSEYNSSTPNTTTHQFRFVITMPTATTVKWNFTLTIDNASSGYTLDPYLDSIALNTPTDGGGINTSSAGRVFNFTLNSDNQTTQSCTLYIDGTAYGTNSSVTNGSVTLMTANSSVIVNGTHSWYVGCNESGDSQNYTVEVTDVSNPVISSISASGHLGTGTFSLSADENVNLSVIYGGSPTTLTSSATETSFASASPSVSVTGLSALTTYHYNTTACDNVGNCVTNGTFQFTTTSASGGGGGTSASSYTVTEGKTKAIAISKTSEKTIKMHATEAKESKMTFTAAGGGHSITVPKGGIDAAKGEVTIIVASTPVTVTLKVGETKKFDLNNNGKYDLRVTLASIVGATQANINVLELPDTEEAVVKPEEKKEAVVEEPVAEEKPEEVVEEVASEELEEEEIAPPTKGFGWLWTIIILVIIIIVVVAILLKKTKGKSRRK